mmetsp:Transcript_18985/g.54702  ORF Transcript_18985/g.54702 Transcript_18985/m.54702 type:complete len:989 (-) Transcript_18985:2672-5638(-)|eukprot:CAMPEP_0181029186 /NCGR_PEP_ID=MMETSP1070-20121207/5061_1 /TAXON_ID=265543 /ORGANISM="Minutocellus polymorphus, Strain NH13" /LENGTH=988 /DNA_ID=CAMNT_0023106473 /DNA_START=130 /DNA_END=3096 /DNA_ORIENTATION=+
MQQEQQQPVWQVRGPGDQEDTTTNRFTSSSSGSRSAPQNETTPLVSADFADNGEQADAASTSSARVQAPQFCSSQAQHHFQYRSITVEHRILLNDLPQYEADSENEEDDRHNGHDHHARDGRSTPSTLSQSGGVMEDDQLKTLDEYETYLNYYQSQGVGHGSGGSRTMLMLLPGGARRRSHRHFYLLATMIVAFTIILATFVAMIGDMAERGYYHHQSNELEREGHRHSGHDDPFDTATVLSSSGYVYAADFADESTTLVDLAQMMLPTWYELTVAQLPIFNPKVMPSEVFNSRKIILKTRDLVDALGPVYQPTSSFRLKKKHAHRQLRKEEDILRTLRFHLNRGYMRVGEFQDLHNAHVLYNVHQLNYYRGRVLDWKDAFDSFIKSHDISAFLSAPSQGCFNRTDSRSHLFWGEIGITPCGSDLATPTLALLGLKQLERASDYLHRSLQFSNIVNEEAHLVYHNLRKELRSLFDEFELFGYLMFATDDPTTTRNDVQQTIKKARKLLGNINDDYTAYSIYVENRQYHDLQKELAARIGASWNQFKDWTNEVDLEGSLAYLAKDMKDVSHSSVPLKAFLQQRLSSPTKHLVIGNPAGDADSIISAVVLAYVDSVKGAGKKTPVISISEHEMNTTRPEVSLLLDLVGISDPSSSLLFVDSPAIKRDTSASGIDVTLVDHNALDERFGPKRGKKGWRVKEILDHHRDEGNYQDTCSNSDRNIAFQDDKALVSSTCTLIAEKLQKAWHPPFPASIALLLLGTILLDTVNLSPEVGKVTRRDIDAVDGLLRNTRWTRLSDHAWSILDIEEADPRPDPSKLFNLLQDAKYNQVFWSTLSVDDSLRYDYKDFAFGETGTSFGVSTVLMPMESFLSKRRLRSSLRQFMDEEKISFLALMFASQVEGGGIHRQLSLCGKDIPTDLLLRVAEYLNNPGLDFGGDGLHLQPVSVAHAATGLTNRGIAIQNFDQKNIQPSRKQIGPMLELFFNASGINI